MPIKISTMTGKLTGIQAVNVDPLSVPFCRSMRVKQDENVICSYCYSCQMLKGARKTCRPAWRANGLLLSLAKLRPHEIPRITSCFCRIHAHGELINDLHMENILKIIKKNKDVKFGFWSKRKDIVAKFADKIPRNVVMVYSNPIIDDVLEEPPKGFHKAFNVIRDGEDKRINCAGRQCAECALCYRKRTTKVIVEHMRGKLVTDLTEETTELDDASDFSDYFELEARETS